MDHTSLVLSFAGIVLACGSSEICAAWNFPHAEERVVTVRRVLCARDSPCTEKLFLKDLTLWYTLRAIFLQFFRGRVICDLKVLWYANDSCNRGEGLQSIQGAITCRMFQTSVLVFKFKPDFTIYHLH